MHIFENIKYRIIDNKYNKLNNDFKIFLDKKESNNRRPGVDGRKSQLRDGE